MGFHNLKRELQALDSKKSKALDNQQRQNETCQNDLNLVNRATNNQAIALTNKKKLIMKVELASRNMMIAIVTNN